MDWSGSYPVSFFACKYLSYMKHLYALLCVWKYGLEC